MTTLIQAMRMFSTEAKAEAWFARQRWPDGVRCPKCRQKDVAERRNRKPLPYYCRRPCRRYFSITSGTLLHRTRVPLRKWAIAMYMMCVHPKGISSVQMGKHLGISQPTAWFMMHRIRKMWSQKQIRNGAWQNSASTVGEFDETYVGGKFRNKPLHRRRYVGRGAVEKFPVVGMINREYSFAAARVIEKTDRPTLHRFVLKNTRSDAAVYTDDHHGYRKMPRFHRTVKHSAKQYVNGDVHTNNIESFWAVLKRAYKGTYHWWSKKHLQRYVDEFVGRHNLRLLDPLHQMSVMAMLSIGKRLTYAELTK